ncbi:MAG: hypothetical protein PHF25_03240 [Candidatus Margulisbacteria bacterium]|nr:hypothetical protein [Candidatus Margulisiibacteriota bacterium]
MASLSRALRSKPKTKLAVSPALIKKMELFSCSYKSIQAIYSNNYLPSSLTYTDEKSLDAFLLEQIENLYLSDLDQSILSRMVELLDENGLFSNWAETREMIQREFNISRRKAYDLLVVFQDLEPEGVGATSIKNFLEIQTIKHDFEDEVFKANTLKILKFEKELISNNLQSISAKTGLNAEEISLSLLFIKNNLEYTLPRQQFSNKSNPSITPSASVATTNNIFKLEILENFDNVENKEVLQILQERRDSLKNILTVFFRKQNPNTFQQSGLLKPITQKDIAEITGLTQSTVSRLVNSKYVLLNEKVYLLKTLFQRKVNHSNYSALFIKKYIAKHIAETDLAITKELQKIGVKLSRRTVNYYRNKFF